MNKHIILASALGFALAGFAPVAMATEGGAGFIRAEVGQSDVKLSSNGVSDSETDTSATFGGGYWFNRYFAIEGHIGTLYTEYLGYDTDLDLVSVGVGVAAKKNFGPDGHGFFIGGRAGMARLTAQVREDDWDVVDDEHSTKPYFGASVGYDFNRRWGMSLNWDRRQADFQGVDVDVDTIAIGGEFRF